MKIPLCALMLLGTSVFLSTAVLRAETPLEGKMQTMKKAFKELVKSMEQPTDADKKKDLALVVKLEEAARQARDLTPEKAAEIPADKRPDFIKSYEKHMEETIVLIEHLKQAVTDANWAEAQKQVEAIKQAQKEGHADFRSEKQ